MKSRIAISDVIRQMDPYKPGSLEEALAPVQMASNENCFGPSPRALQAIERILKTVNRYPEDTGAELRDAIAAHLRVRPEEVILGNGSTELVEMLLRTYLEPGENSVTATPTFVMYRLATLMARGECKEVPLRDFRYDTAALFSAVDEKTRVVLIANPNNPTGTMIYKEEMDEFLSGIQSHVIIVLDEAYREYIDSPNYPDGIELQRNHPNVVVFRTFSKIHSLAGLRLGYGIADAEIIETVNRMRSPFNTSSIAQAAALAALQDEEHIRRSRESNQRERAFLENELKARNVSVVPSVANFLYLPHQNALQLQQQLLTRGIFVRALPGGLRVTLGTHEENLAFLGALAVTVPD